MVGHTDQELTPTDNLEGWSQRYWDNMWLITNHGHQKQATTIFRHPLWSFTMDLSHVSIHHCVAANAAKKTKIPTMLLPLCRYDACHHICSCPGNSEWDCFLREDSVTRIKGKNKFMPPLMQDFHQESWEKMWLEFAELSSWSPRLTSNVQYDMVTMMMTIFIAFIRLVSLQVLQGGA